MSHGIYGPGLWPSKAKTELIITATGIDFPAGQDTAELRADLNQCRLQILDKQINKGYLKGQKQKAKASAKKASELRQIITSGGLFHRRLWMALDDYESLVNSLIRIEQISDDFLKTNYKTADGGGIKESLVELLVPIYENHFNKRAGRRRDGSGPFQRFVEAVSNEMGDSLRTSPHTVYRAFSKNGSIKSRLR